MSEALLGGISGLTGLLGIGGTLASSFRDEPAQEFRDRPPFRGTITTPAFSFGGGALKRTGTDAFSFPGFASSLGGVRTGLEGLRGRIDTLRPAIAGGLSGAQGLFGRTNALRGAIGGLDSTLAGLQDQVQPGFGRLSKSAVNTIRNRASASAGNLRESLSRRNVLGSSFANAQQASIAKDFAQLEEQTRAQAIVAEIEATRGIVQDRAGLIELSGRLIELDQRSLQEQARFIALDLGATEAELSIFQQQVSTIQTEMQAFRDQISRELQELNISTNFLKVVDQFLSGQASSQIQQAASQIGGGGGQGGEGESRERFRDEFGRTFGSPSTATGLAEATAGLNSASETGDFGGGGGDRGGFGRGNDPGGGAEGSPF